MRELLSEVANGPLTKRWSAVSDEAIWAADRIVVLTDAFYPGWEAALDGAPVAVLRANTAVRAVVVPAGDHVVEMRYRAHSFRRGLVLAGIAAVLLGVAMNWGRGGTASAQL